MSIDNGRFKSCEIKILISRFHFTNVKLKLASVNCRDDGSNCINLVRLCRACDYLNTLKTSSGIELMVALKLICLLLCGEVLRVASKFVI